MKSLLVTDGISVKIYKSNWCDIYLFNQIGKFVFEFKTSSILSVS